MPGVSPGAPAHGGHGCHRDARRIYTLFNRWAPRLPDAVRHGLGIDIPGEKMSSIEEEAFRVARKRRCGPPTIRPASARAAGAPPPRWPPLKPRLILHQDNGRNRSARSSAARDAVIGGIDVVANAPTRSRRRTVALPAWRSRRRTTGSSPRPVAAHVQSRSSKTLERWPSVASIAARWPCASAIARIPAEQKRVGATARRRQETEWLTQSTPRTQRTLTARHSCCRRRILDGPLRIALRCRRNGTCCSGSTAASAAIALGLIAMTCSPRAAANH